MNLPDYEVYAIRYARRDARRADHFIGGDPHEGPMAMDYFVWLIRNAERTIVVDTGFTAEVAKRRKREFIRAPKEIIDRLNAELVKSLKDPEFAARMRGMGLELYGTTPAQFAQFIRDENAKWAKVIKATGARVD